MFSSRRIVLMAAAVAGHGPGAKQYEFNSAHFVSQEPVEVNAHFTSGAVGDRVGGMLGEGLGARVTGKVGAVVGAVALLGRRVGALVGDEDAIEGTTVGRMVGAVVGNVNVIEGRGVGGLVTAAVGVKEGATLGVTGPADGKDGPIVGKEVLGGLNGDCVGLAGRLIVGMGDFLFVGDEVGFLVGALVGTLYRQSLKIAA